MAKEGVFSNLKDIIGSFWRLIMADFTNGM